MFYLQGNHIYLTKGDTAYLTVSLKNADGTTYSPAEGDVVRFAMKPSFDAETCALNKNFDMETMQLAFLPEDTKDLPVRSYVYDIELTDASSRVTTVISDNLTLLEEVC